MRPFCPSSAHAELPKTMLEECKWQVTMNNTLCLGVFLLVIYQQRLPWVYSSEVAVILGASLSTCQHPVTGSFCI